jgi:chromate transporter
MSEPAAKPPFQRDVTVGTPSATVSVGRIFLEFLVIGAISFGGVVPYLRDNLVAKRQWLDDTEFVELLSISQSLPGLNATNMAILVGQKLGGGPGAIVALLGICLPGGLLMFIAGILYRAHGDHAWATAALKGVAAASVGLVLATVVQLSRRTLEQPFDFVLVIMTVIAINRLHQSVLVTLIAVGLLAVLWHRPRKGQKVGTRR